MYWTKKGSTPIQYRGLMDAVFVCRARQNAGLDLKDYPIPFWAEKAYLVGAAVYNLVENSSLDEDDGSEWQVTGKGDSGAFALINEHMREMKGKRIN